MDGNNLAISALEAQAASPACVQNAESATSLLTAWLAWLSHHKALRQTELAVFKMIRERVAHLCHHVRLEHVVTGGEGPASWRLLLLKPCCCLLYIPLLFLCVWYVQEHRHCIRCRHLHLFQFRVSMHSQAI